MRTLTKPLVSLVALVASLAVAAHPASAQSVVVGGVAGVSRSRQLRDRAADSGSRTGFVAGAWVDVASPVAPLHFLAEAAYARRGGTFPLGGPAGLTGDVESDWLAATVAPMLSAGIGPVAVYAYGGPTLEVPVRTRTAAALRTAFATPSDQGLSVTAGAGLEARLGRWSIRGEVRLVEGLSSAYSGSAGEIRHRSTEVVLRVGKRRGGEPEGVRPPHSEDAVEIDPYRSPVVPERAGRGRDSLTGFPTPAPPAAPLESAPAPATS